MSQVYLGTIDQGGDGHAVLLANVNAVLGKNYTLDEFDFTDPSAITVPNPSRNTRIGLSPKAESGYYGTLWIYYNRIHVTQLGTITVQRGSATDVVGLLPAINEKYGILIKPEDVYNNALPPAIPGEDSVSFTLEFRPTSVIYYGGALIVLGDNDPTMGGGGGTSAPFVGELIAFNSLTAQSIAFDADKTRKRYGDVRTIADPMTFRDIFFQEEVNQANQLPERSTIRGSWKTSQGVVRAVTIYGEVLQQSADWNSWTKVGSIASLDLNDETVVQDLIDDEAMRFVKQHTDGTLYALFDQQFYSSADNGDTWVALTLTGADDLKVYNESGSSLGIHDVVVQSGKLFVLISANSIYPGDVDATNTVGVEYFDLTTLVAGKIQLNNKPFKNGRPALEHVAGWTAMTFRATGGWGPAVVGQFEVGARYQVLQFIPTSGGVYELYEVRSSERIPLTTENTGYVHAYDIPLVKNTHTLEVIEIGSWVKTTAANVAAYLELGTKAADGYYAHGILAITRLRSASGQYSKWTESQLISTAAGLPTKVTVTEAGRRMHYHHQPGVGLVRLRYVENDTVNGFQAAVDTTYSLAGHKALLEQAEHGVGVYTAPVLVETANTSYTLAAYSNTEAAKPVVEMSYVAKNASGERLWLTAATLQGTLTSREIGHDFAGMSTTPVVTAAMGSELLYLSSDSDLLMSSTDKGHIWKPRNTLVLAAMAANEDHTTIRTDHRVELAYRPEDFLHGSFMAGHAHFHVRVSRNLQINNATTKTIDQAIMANSDQLIHIDDTVNDIETVWDDANAFEQLGVDVLNSNQPKQLYAWKVEAGGTTQVYGKYTELAAAPMGQILDQIGYDHPSLPAGFVPLGMFTEFDYLDIDRIYFGYITAGGNDIYHLFVIDNSDVLHDVQLYGGLNPSFASFKPEIGYALWNYADANYVPFVLYGDKRVFLIGRLDEEGEIMYHMQGLSIPNDTGADLTIVPMFNQNRREYYFAQKGNGIYRMTYAYNAGTKEYSLGLQLMHALSGPLADLDIISGAHASSLSVSAPTTPLIPTYPPAGTLLSWECQGFDKIGTYADGSGGTTTSLVEENSADCGYTAPPPVVVGAPETELVFNTTSTSSSLYATQATVGEDETAYAIFELDEELVDDTTVVLDTIFDGAATSDDIDSMDYVIGTSTTWIPITAPQSITIPAGERSFTIRVIYVEDATTEGTETFTVRVEKAVGNTNLTNTTPLDVVFTINDTSV